MLELLLRVVSLCAVLTAVTLGFHLAGRVALEAIDKGQGLKVALVIAIALVLFVAGVFALDAVGIVSEIGDLF